MRTCLFALKYLDDSVMIEYDGDDEDDYYGDDE